MEIAAWALGLLSAALVIIITIVALGGHKYVALWLGVAALCTLFGGGGCWLHDRWKKEDSRGQHGSNVVLDFPAGSFVETKPGQAPPAITTTDPESPTTEYPEDTTPTYDLIAPADSKPAVEVGSPYPTAKEITDTVRKAPDLLKKKVGESYVGRHVSWDMKLLKAEGGIDEDDSYIAVSETGDYDASYVTVPIHFPEHNFLIPLEKGAPLRVEGKIKDVIAPVAIIRLQAGTKITQRDK